MVFGVTVIPVTQVAIAKAAEKEGKCHMIRKGSQALREVTVTFRGST